MKVKCEIIVNLDTGSYEVKFINLSQPDEDIDYDIMLEAISKITEDLYEKAEIDDPKITKLLN